MQIVNIVATVKLSSPLDLSELQKRLEGAEFAKGATWLKMRLKPEDHYIAFYKSGKFLITGLDSTEKIEAVADRVLSLLCGAGIEAERESLTIQNYVLMDRLELSSSLESLIHTLGMEEASYEPEQFPGLIYKRWGATFLLFNSGKFIATGLKDEQKAKRVIEQFKQMLER